MTNAVDHDRSYVEMTNDVSDKIYEGSRFDLDPTDDGYSFTGIDPAGVAIDGREIVIINISQSHSVNLAHNSTDSQAGNRLFFSDNIDHELQPLQMVWGIRIEGNPDRVGWWMQF